MMQVCTEMTLDHGLVLDVQFATIAPAADGTVTSLSVVTANGVSGSVANPTTTPAITITLGDITPSKVNGNTITSGTGTLSLSSYTLTMTGAASLQGTNTGDQTISLTGDVTGSGTSTFAATISASAVTLSKMSDVATGTVFYRKTAGTGAPEVQTLATLKTDLGLTGTNSGDQTISLTGDVTGSGTGGFAATIANDAVTFAKIQNSSAASKLLGRGSASGAGDFEEITLGTQLSMSGTTLNVSSTGAADSRSAVYNPFTPSGDDDEFDDASFSGWTAVNSGSHNPTITEANDVVSMLFPGSDASAELHAYMKSRSMSAGTASVEAFFRGYGRNQNFNICGLILADGVTYGAGSQFIIYHSPQEVNALRWAAFTNYSTVGTAGSVSAQSNAPHGDLGLRLVYTAANTFRGYCSIDGISWIDFTGAITRTLTPTYAGFFATTWSGTQRFVWSWRYCRFTS